MRIFKSKLQPMRIKRVGKYSKQSFAEWKEYINHNEQMTKIRKYLKPYADNIVNRLNNIDNRWLGEHGLYREIEVLRTKATKLKDDIGRFLKIKQFMK